MTWQLTQELPLFRLSSFTSLKRLSFAFIALLLSPSLLALGLGELTHQSHLGQPLEARIELISPEKNYGINEIKVRQLSVQDASKMGIELLSFFNRFKLTPLEENGKLYVRLYSQESVTEPFVNLLVELKWPTGSVYREYTLLLDLPVIKAAQAAAKEQAPKTGKRLSTAKPKAVSKAQPLNFSDQQYRVRSGDSLSKIAQRLTATNQHNRRDVMHWLLVNNPHAFIKGDPNRLKAAVNLKLPQEANLSPVASEQHTLGEPAKRAAQSSVKQAAPNPIMGQQQDDKPSDSSIDKSVDGQARLTLKTSDMDSASLQDLKRQKEEKLKERIRRTQEQNDQLERENKAIEARLNRLEGSSYIQSLERLVQLREQEIAQLNTRLNNQQEGGQTNANTLGQRFSEPQGLTVDSSLTAAAAVKEAPADDKAEPAVEDSSVDQRLWLWGLLLLAVIGCGYFYWHQKKSPTEFREEDENRDDDAELARLEAALEAQDQTIGYDASDDDLNFSSLFDEDGRPTGAAHVGKYRPDEELSKKIQNKTENYVADTPRGLHVEHHHGHDNLDDLISDALAYCAQGYYDKAESILLAEQSLNGAESRISTALDYIANLKKDL